MSECANHVEMYTAAFQSIIILHSRCVGEQQKKKIESTIRVVWPAS